MTIARLVFLTDSMSVFSSSGHVVRGSTTSALMPISSSASCRRERHLHHAARRDERDVAALALHVGHAERNDVVVRPAPAP